MLRVKSLDGLLGDHPLWHTPECPICWETFTHAEHRSPRILPCGHSLCHTCVAQLQVLPLTGGARALICPECRTQVPYRGVHAFPKNYTLLRMMDKSSVPRPSAIHKKTTPPKPAWERCLQGFGLEPAVTQLRALASKIAILAGAVLGLAVLVPGAVVYMMVGWWAAWLSCLLFWWLTIGLVGYMVGMVFVFLCFCWVELLSGRLGIRLLPAQG